jgi:hypothetical protein
LENKPVEGEVKSIPASLNKLSGSVSNLGKALTEGAVDLVEVWQKSEEASVGQEAKNKVQVGKASVDVKSAGLALGRKLKESGMSLDKFRARVFGTKK